MMQEKKRAIITLYREMQEVFLTGNLPLLLDGLMQLVMCGLHNVCKCMDGRQSVGRHLAGVGLLLWYLYGEEYTISVMRQMGLTGICTHDDCGAAKIVAVLRGKGEDPNELSRWWGAYIALILEIPYLGHLPVRYNFHPETVIVVDGTGGGHWTPTGLPERMVINAGYPVHDYVAKEISIALEIIFGESGMGGILMEQDLPLLVLAVGDPRPGGTRVQRIADLAGGVLKDMEGVHGGHFVLREYMPPIGAFP